MISTALRVAVVILSFVMSSGTQAGAELRVGVGLGMEEVVGTSKGQISGILAPIYRCVFDKANVDARFVSVPVKRGLQYLRSDQISVLLPLARNAKRDGMATFAGTLFEAEYVFVSYKPLLAVEGTPGLRYAIPRSFIGRQFIPDESANIQEVTEWQQLVALLAHGRVDVAIIPEPMVEPLFGAQAEQIYSRTAGRLPVSMYLSDATEQSGLAERIRRSVELCRVDGPIQRGRLTDGG
ncbi:MAG: transporter substrate-binding domain-containing protein [Gammaproteobacteria bacterium]|nr:MAG: transporter substrate-binding domain-containing protein [Gammaproteobacteria bacterium]